MKRWARVFLPSRAPVERAVEPGRLRSRDRIPDPVRAIGLIDDLVAPESAEWEWML